MNSRTWLAISLACFIWFGYLKWFAPPPPVPSSISSTPSQEQTTQSAESAAENKKSVSQSFSSPVEVLPISSTLYRTANQDFEVSFSAKGGRPAQVELKEYKSTLEKNAEFIRTLNPVVHSHSLAALFSDSELNALGSSEHSLEGRGNKVTMTAGKPNGLRLVKEYTVSDRGFTIDAILRLQVPRDGKRNYGTLLIPIGGQGLEYSHEVPLKSWELVYLQDEKVKRNNWDALPETEEVKQGNTVWVAFGNRYFSTVLVNQSDINPDIVMTRTKAFGGAYLRYPLVVKDGQTEAVYKYKIYAGPKIVTELEKIEGLKELIDYGMFSFFAYPLLGILRFFYNFVHNYGIAIILLTLLVRLLFYPLSVKSYKSMKAMQKLQPQIQTLKEKYKNDTARMNQEQMALFKAHKVNPMGGCFPMLVQLPVFIALYAVLGNSIELFQAPFFGWIRDLSTKDPYYVYPVLMGIAMFLQQKMTPAVGMDPAQQKIMLFMPVIFSFMMVGLPSGLTLYIFVSTLLGIVQQWAMMRDPNPTPTLAVVEPSTKTK